MRKRCANSLQIAAMLLSVLTAAPGVAAKHAPASPLEDELRTRYKPVRMGFGGGGLAVVEPGTVLVLQKEGILAVPPSSLVIAPGTYKDGEIHPPNAFLRAALGDNTRLLTAGERVYVSKISVNLKSDKVALAIIECDACNSADFSSYKAEVVFQFPKGYLESADAAKIQQTIGEVLAFDIGGAGTQQAQDQTEQPPTQPPPPPTIEVGQTVDQVQAAFGPPDRFVNLGSKLIYVYKDRKVTFVDGKVAAVN